MFLMRFTKKNSNNFAFCFIEKIIQSLSIFRKSKNPEIFGKSKIEHRSISIENFQKPKIFNRKFRKFRKFSKIFGKNRKFSKLWRFFSTKNVANFLMFFFKPHQKDLISPNCWTVFHHSAMRFPEVTQSETMFSLFFTTNHQKRNFLFEKQSFSSTRGSQGGVPQPQPWSGAQSAGAAPHTGRGPQSVQSVP